MRTGWILEAVSVASLATLSAGRVARSNTNAVANDVEAGQNTARDSRAIAATSNYLTLRKRTRPTTRNSPESHKRDTPKDATPPPGYPFNAGLTNVKDAYYVADIKIGDETVAVSVDTGSSDTWLIKSPFTCVDYYQRNMPESKCGFNKGLQGNLSQGILHGELFSRGYADGTYVSGYFGFEDVTVGGVHIEHQQLAVVNFTYWWGEGKTAGLMGLAYPLMTGLTGGVKAYDPVFTSMWKSEQIMPLFTMALSRDDEGRNVTHEEKSFLAFGGLPPVEYDDATWARTPLLSMQTVPSWGVETDARGLYIIQADAYVYGKAKDSNMDDPSSTKGLTVNTTQFPILVDSGASLTVLPKDLANAVFKSFHPPAQYLPNDGAWFAPCNAKMARFGVKIGTQQIYWMNPDDLLRQGARDSETGRLCRIGIIDSDGGPPILGVTFLSNVVAVFDVGNDEMRFAKRLDY